MDRQAIAHLQAFYTDQLASRFIPFWEAAVDRERGGLFTCFDNAGARLISKHKYTWSQGRSIWLWSRLAELCRTGLLPSDAGTLLEYAARTAAFVERHAILENGECAYVVAEDGTPFEPSPGLGLACSLFADCFVVLGLAEYARVAQDRQRLERAIALLESIERRVRTGKLLTEPYPIPEGYRAQSVPMILLNITQETAAAAASLGHEQASALNARAAAWMDEILTVFRAADDDTLSEMLPPDAAHADTLLVNHIAPGHTLECMWFVIHQARAAGTPDAVLPTALAVMQKAYELGWDRQYGGFFRYVSRNGGQPAGRLLGHRMETLIADTWDTKIWWIHSEALYASLLAYEASGDPAWLERYRMTEKYVFGTFPNPDERIGEWIQIRNRQGEPLEKEVALPVKDPFHIIRNFILIVELLSAMRQRSDSR